MGAFSFANILLPDILHDLIVQRLGCVCVVGADDVDALVNRQHDAGLIARSGFVKRRTTVRNEKFAKRLGATRHAYQTATARAIVPDRKNCNFQKNFKKSELFAKKKRLYR